MTINKVEELCSIPLQKKKVLYLLDRIQELNVSTFVLQFSNALTQETAQSALSTTDIVSSRTLREVSAVQGFKESE